MPAPETHIASPITSSTSHLPRILCLHGGGVTAEIFRLQLRSLAASLSAHFRLVFADGPFLCNPGPGMLPVYGGMGPYRRWLRWIDEEHPGVGDEEAVEEMEYKMREAMGEDDARGGRGEWAGVLGFSQGAKVAASVLYESQLRMEEVTGKKLGSGKSIGYRFANGTHTGQSDEKKKKHMDLSDMLSGIANGTWKFAILLAGRAPLVKLSDLSVSSTTMCGAGAVSEGGFEFDVESNMDRLVLPTVHVHGCQDPGLHLHRRLRDYYTEGDAVETVEWDGGHRVPLKKDDTERVKMAILRASRKAGVLEE